MFYFSTSTGKTKGWDFSYPFMRIFMAVFKQTLPASPFLCLLCFQLFWIKSDACALDSDSNSRLHLFNTMEQNDVKWFLYLETQSELFFFFFGFICWGRRHKKHSEAALQTLTKTCHFQASQTKTCSCQALQIKQVRDTAHQHVFTYYRLQNVPVLRCMLRYVHLFFSDCFLLKFSFS